LCILFVIEIRNTFLVFDKIYLIATGFTEDLMNKMVLSLFAGLAMVAWMPVGLHAGDKDTKINIKKIYKKRCLKCHGIKGDGKGKGAKLIKSVEVTAFTSSKWSDDRTDEQIFDAIKFGPKAKSVKVNKKMKAYKSKLKDPEIKALVKYIRAFGKTKGEKSKKKVSKEKKKSEKSEKSSEDKSEKDDSKSKSDKTESKSEKKSE